MADRIYITDPESGERMYVTKEDLDRYNSMFKIAQPKVKGLGSVFILPNSLEGNESFKKLWNEPPPKDTK